MRHAKAVQPDGWLDLDRPLTDRGHADATAGGQWLAASGLRPEIVLCSTATRTRDTWLDVAAAFDEVPVHYPEEIYLASPRELVALVQAVPADAATALLVGHNPSVTMLSALLDPRGDIADGLATAGIAVHTWEGDWLDCGPRMASLAATHTARGSAT